jgi:hypothetical protein
MNIRTLCGTGILLFDPHDVALSVNMGAVCVSTPVKTRSKATLVSVITGASK